MRLHPAEMVETASVHLCFRWQNPQGRIIRSEVGVKIESLNLIIEVSIENICVHVYINTSTLGRLVRLNEINTSIHSLKLTAKALEHRQNFRGPQKEIPSSNISGAKFQGRGNQLRGH